MKKKRRLRPIIKDVLILAPVTLIGVYLTFRIIMFMAGFDL